MMLLWKLLRATIEHLPDFERNANNRVQSLSLHIFVHVELHGMYGILLTYSDGASIRCNEHQVFHLPSIHIDTFEFTFACCLLKNYLSHRHLNFYFIAFVDTKERTINK